ncbi:MAG: hypothetical protein H7Z14_00160 [Anaerolineae bacterium]|nr:hypothetical protein [Phycisphaerae bacterium]
MADINPPNRFDGRESNGRESDGPESIDAYCDDQMSSEKRSRFEEQLAREPALRDAVARQRQIDQSLQRMFMPVIGAGLGADAVLAKLKPPHAAEVPAPSNGKVIHHSQHATHNVQPRKFVRTPLAIAAALVFLVCGPFAIWNAWDAFYQPSKVAYEPKPVRPLDVAYRAEVESGFNCDWACKSQNEFGAYFAAGFGQPLQMKDPPADVASIGLKYTGGITPNTISYMARVQGQPVMVFADKLDADAAAGQTLANPKGLHIYKRTIGPLVLYEVSPLDKPMLLDLFYTP